MHIARLLCVSLIGGTLLAQNPAFTGIVNPASNIPPGMPNYGIAQGSIFVIYGSNMGPSTLTASNLPLPTSAGLAGTTITVTVGSTTVNAPIIYTRADIVAAVMPSTTPTGNGTLTLTYNGKSGSSPLKIMASNFGISTVNQSGSGPAVVTRPDFSLITTSNSAKPGDTLVIWGTGLGPVAGGDTNLPAAVDLGTPIQVLIGNVPATITYRGRSGYPGLDQINVVVPQNAPTGCTVGVIVQTTTPATVSNAPTIAISPNGGACSDPTIQVTPSFLNANSAKVVYLQLQRQSQVTSQNGQPVTNTSNAAHLFFWQFSQAQIAAVAQTANTIPSLGTCLTGIVQGNGGSGLPDAKFLNAG